MRQLIIAGGLIRMRGRGILAHLQTGKNPYKGIDWIRAMLLFELEFKLVINYWAPNG